MARVALALRGVQRARNGDLVSAVLPQREPAAHRLHALVAEVLDQGPRGPGRSVAGRAVQDQVLGAIGDSALNPRLQIALRYVLGAGDVAGGPLLGLAHI